MKKITKLLLSSLLILPLFNLTGCNKGNSLDKKENEDLELEGFISNITNAKNIGIIPGSKSSKKNLANEETYEKDTVIMNKYGVNKQEEMKFTKLVYNKDKSIVNHTIEVVALPNEDETTNSITFKVDEGFKYSLFKNKNDETPMYSDIKDNSSLDKNSKENYVTIDNLDDHHVYYVKCEGHGEKIELRQNELSYRVQSLFSTKGLTFIKFHKFLNGLEYKDVPHRLFDSTYFYDFENMRDVNKNYRGNYFTRKDDFEDIKSYVIDNKTGNIYKIENYYISFPCDEIIHGSIPSTKEDYEESKKHDGYFEFRINDQDEFELSKICNPIFINANSVFKDKYGYNYVNNQKIEKYDANTKTLFYKNNGYSDNIVNYFLNSKKEAVKVVINNRGIINSINIVNENRELEELKVTDEFYIPYINATYKNGYLYYSTYRNNIIAFFRYDIKNKETVGMLNSSEYQGKSINVNTFSDPYSSSYIDYFLEKGIVLFVINNNLYYIENIWDVLDKYIAILGENNSLDIDYTDIEELKVLINHCNIDYHTGLFKATTVNGDIFYEVHLSRDNDKYKFDIYKQGEYKELNKIVLQPINK